MNQNIIKDDNNFHVESVSQPQGFSKPGMYVDFNKPSALNDIDIPDSEAKALHDIFFKITKSREDVLDFEEFINNLPTCVMGNPYPLFHKFANGMYSREIHFNKGDLITGAIHKNEYFVNVLKGKIWVVSEFGAKEIIAPALDKTDFFKAWESTW